MTGTHNHIDRLQLARLIGDNPDLLARLAAAFLRQLPVWLADFELHSQAGDTERVAKLLHKMKGSCHAVSATAVALEFEKAEHALGASLPWNGDMLLQLLQEMKKEFTLILAGRTPCV
jgi:HPt (histidine-containing phosphotransfer) domain-containing protein